MLRKQASISFTSATATTNTNTTTSLAITSTNQVSNWGRRPLKPDQITYAALDARASLLIFDEMMKFAEVEVFC